MFTENEIAALITNPDINGITVKLKTEFIKMEAPFLEISNHDFLSLLLLTPSVGIALANDNVSLMEEMALNKKARRYSKGGYLMKQDPVVIAMGYLIKHYDLWSEIFYKHLNHIVALVLDKEKLTHSNIADERVTVTEFYLELLKSPFVLVRFLSSFLSNSESDDIGGIRKVPKMEYDRMIEILKKIDLINIPLVKHYLTKLVVK
jgi:hypothetical protein